MLLSVIMNRYPGAYEDNSENICLRSFSWAWCLRVVIPALGKQRERERKRERVPGHPGLHSHILSQKQQQKPLIIKSD